MKFVLQYTRVPIGDEWPKALGYLVLESNPEPSRRIGYEGRREEVLTRPIELLKGCGNIVRVSASPKRPLKVWTEIMPVDDRPAGSKCRMP